MGSLGEAAALYRAAASRHQLADELLTAARDEVDRLEGELYQRRREESEALLNLRVAAIS